jgi:acylphosphatase
VKVVAEASQEQLADLIRFLHEGPPSARVDDVEVAWELASGEYKDFRVRFR